MTVNKLVLWDIDHTLIETGGVGSEVFRDAFEQVTGHKIDKLTDVTGRTEQVIFRETMEMYDIDDPGDYFPKFVETQAEGYRDRADEMRRRGRVLPGAREALEALAKMPRITQAVLTGNPQPSAIAKLDIFDLIDGLDLNSGAYGTDDSVRSNLVRIAQRRAAQRHRIAFDEATTIVVGDTASDVEAALEGGAGIIAVASGSTSADDLRKTGASRVLDTLVDLRTLISSITED